MFAVINTGKGSLELSPQSGGKQPDKAEISDAAFLLSAASALIRAYDLCPGAGLATIKL